MNLDTMTDEQLEQLFCGMCDESVEVPIGGTLPAGWQVVELPKMFEVDVDQWLLVCNKCYECFEIPFKVRTNG